MAKIGVFDSGIGGQSVVNAIKAALPEHEVEFRNDVEHVPYATKQPDEIIGYVDPILNQLVALGCDVIVIACNTVSTTLIDELRQRIRIPLIAMEPMVKPAAEQTKSNTVAVFATPTTLASKRYAWLKREYAQGIKVIEPDCSNWSYMIETNNIDQKNVRRVVEEACDQGADVLVLGCTHYHWIEDIIIEIAKGRAVVIQPEKPVVAQLNRVLKGITKR